MDPVALVTFSHRYLAYLVYFAAAWLLTWAAYWSVGAFRTGHASGLGWHWSRLLGVAMVVWPFVRYANLIYEDFATVLDTTSVAVAVPASVWWESIGRRFVQYVFLPLVGMYLAFGFHLRLGRDLDVLAGLRRTLERTMVWPRKSWARAGADGLLLFVVVFFGYLALAYLLSPLQDLDTGDESQVFTLLTPLLGAALALTAGVTEEFLFRGVLQQTLRRVMPLWVAIGIQGIAFGLIHSGYGTVSHILFAAVFGIALGALVPWFGVLPLIIVHTLVNLVIFMSTVSTLGYPGAAFVVPLVFVTAVVLPATYYGYRFFVARFGTRQGPLG